MRVKEIARGVWMVGGPDLSDGRDACAYLLADGGEAALIDAGAGVRPELIARQITETNVSHGSVKKIILTHCHIDHTGGAAALARELGAAIVCHARCADILAVGDDPRTASSWYGLSLPPLTADETFVGEQHTIKIGQLDLILLYTPGHSPCSISVFVDLPGTSDFPADPEADPPKPARALRVLFGQDVHGPVHPALESNPRLYTRSLHRLISLEADVLCEGHFGVYRPAATVRRYIESYLRG